MLDYQGEMTNVSLRDPDRVIFPDSTSDGLYELPTVSSTCLEDQIDANISSNFYIPPLILDNPISPDFDVDFCEALSFRGEISKMEASIGSCNISSVDSDPFCLDKPFFGTIDSLKDILDPEKIHYIESKVSSVQANKSKGPSKEFLSKLWMVSEPLAEAALDHNTQLCRHNADNTLSRRYSTND